VAAHSRLPLVVSFVFAAASPSLGQEAAKGLQSIFMPGSEVCYGRHYDSAYLAEHSQQKVTDLYVFHSLTDDTQSELDQKDKALRAEEDSAQFAQLSKSDAESGVVPELRGQTNANVVVHFRDKSDWYGNDLTCRPSRDGGFTCNVDCDGGNFDLLHKESWLRFILGGSGLALRGSCGESNGDNGIRWVPGPDDQLYRIDPLDMAECLRARDATRPEFAKLDPPLRTKFANTKATCLGNSRIQGLKGIVSVSLQVIKYVHGTTDDSNPKFHARFAYVRSGGSATMKPIICTAIDFQYDCLLDVDPQPETFPGFSLRRDGHGGILVSDRDPSGHSLAYLMDLKVDTTKSSPSIMLEETSSPDCAP